MPHTSIAVSWATTRLGDGFLTTSFLADGLRLLPCRSLIENSGFSIQFAQAQPTSTVHGARTTVVNLSPMVPPLSRSPQSPMPSTLSEWGGNSDTRSDGDDSLASTIVSDAGNHSTDRRGKIVEGGARDLVFAEP